MADVFLDTPDGRIKCIRPLVGFKDEMQDRLKKFPFAKNVFLMLRFRDSNKMLSDFILEVLAEAGLNGVRADQPEWNITNNVYNPIACLYCCRYGIALFDEAEEGQTFNPNVIYELATMHSFDRSCLILKNASLPSVPFDLIKDLHKQYTSDLMVRNNVRHWLKMVEPDFNPSASAKEQGHTVLEIAAALERRGEIAEIVAVPDGIDATDFVWKIGHEVAGIIVVGCSIRLANKLSRQCWLRLQFLFTDGDGFALDDRRSKEPIAIDAGQSRSHLVDVAMDGELARRVTKVFVTVDGIDECC